MTCGYYGAGYRTQLYQYDNSKVVGYIGEKVDLEFIEDTDFPEGKLMYYYASKDIHTQYPVESLSASVNLILPRKGETRLQYFFDMNQKTIRNHINELSLRAPIFRTLTTLGDGNSIDLLLRIADQHPCFRTRSMAWDTLLKMSGIDTEHLHDQAMRDSSPFVHQTVQATMSRLSL